MREALLPLLRTLRIVRGHGLLHPSLLAKHHRCHWFRAWRGPSCRCETSWRPLWRRRTPCPSTCRCLMLCRSILDLKFEWGKLVGRVFRIFKAIFFPNILVYVYYPQSCFLFWQVKLWTKFPAFSFSFATIRACKIMVAHVYFTCWFLLIGYSSLVTCAYIFRLRNTVRLTQRI